jgi:hypothetical protein
MAANTVTGKVDADRRRRREAAEQRASDIPREQLQALNLCAGFLSALEPQAALQVIRRLERGLVEHIAIAARAGSW